MVRILFVKNLPSNYCSYKFYEYRGHPTFQLGANNKVIFFVFVLKASISHCLPNIFWLLVWCTMKIRRGGLLRWWKHGSGTSCQTEQPTNWFTNLYYEINKSRWRRTNATDMTIKCDEPKWLREKVFHRDAAKKKWCYLNIFRCVASL